jgi:hypothetical protein
MSVPTFTRRDFGFAALATFAWVGLGPGARAAESLPKVVVFKDPSCGCCGAWADHVRAAGFPIEVIETGDLAALKARLGVPETIAGCHSAQVAGYVIEGHVPAPAIRRLLAERPDGIGLAVPGMPVGSPGMEVRGAAAETYDVILFGRDHQRRFARFSGGREL